MRTRVLRARTLGAVSDAGAEHRGGIIKMTEYLEDRETSRNMQRLTPALRFLKPYRLQVVLASAALCVTATAMLLLGQGIRIVIDNGFASGQAALLTESLILFVLFVTVLTAGTLSLIHI